MKNFERCTLSKMPNPRIRPPMGNLLATIPLQILAIDFTVLEPVTEGRENVLVEPVNDPRLAKKVHRGNLRLSMTNPHMEQKDPGPKPVSKSRSIDPSNEADEEDNLDEELVLIPLKGCTKVLPEPSDGPGPI